MASIPQISLDFSTPLIRFDFEHTDTQELSPICETDAASDTHLEAENLAGKPCEVENCTYSATALLSKDEQPPQDHAVVVPSRQSSLSRFWKRLHHERRRKRSTSEDSSTTQSNTTSSSISLMDGASTLTSITMPSISRTTTAWPTQFHNSRLAALPSSILRQILSYALALPRTVSIGPPDIDTSYLHSSEYGQESSQVPLSRVLSHPLFLVSHSIRSAATEVLFARSLVVIDLASIYNSKVSSVIHDNIKRHHKFWAYETPHWVKWSLRKVSKLAIRLPVPSTEVTVRYGREEEDWIDGSNGIGGGSYRIKNMREEEDDAMAVRRCLHAVVQLLLAPRTIRPKFTRSVSNLTIHRPKTARTGRSNSSLSFRSELGETVDPEDEDHGERHPLKFLEITLVKRSSTAMVLQEALGLIHTLRVAPVAGRTRICLELDGRKSIWATKRRKRWEGDMPNTEPDGALLLHGELPSITLMD